MFQIHGYRSKLIIWYVFFDLRRYDATRVHAEMTEPKACWLNSRDAFVVVGEGKAYLWIGLGANTTYLVPNAQTIAKKIAQFYSAASYPRQMNISTSFL